MKTVKQIGRPLTETVARQPRSAFVQNWDAQAGLSQTVQRTRERSAMGRKMTPKLGGTLKPK
jgi:hypothetical protein